MNTRGQIEQYLEELAQALLDLGVTTPFHILIAGGAYMILQGKRQFTLDIDFAIIESLSNPSGAVFHATIQRAEVFNKRSTVPFAAEFRQAVEIIAQHHQDLLEDDWMNDEAASYYYDDAPQADVILWRSFGNSVYVYLPTAEYVLATKIAAYRPKDIDDIRVLVQELGIRTRAQAKAVVDTFLLPDAQAFWEVDATLEELFP